jgi:hypothetical protein
MRALIARAPAADARTANRTSMVLACGVVAGLLFTVVGLAQAVTRWFHLRRHALGVLETGDLGWLQIGSFLQGGRGGTWEAWLMTWAAGDGSPIHRGQPLKDFRRTGAAKRLHVEQLPGYALELNPDKGIWNALKRVELGYCCCRDLAEWAMMWRHAKERLRHTRTVIQPCLQ